MLKPPLGNMSSRLPSSPCHTFTQKASGSSKSSKLHVVWAVILAVHGSSSTPLCTRWHVSCAVGASTAHLVYLLCAVWFLRVRSNYGFDPLSLGKEKDSLIRFRESGVIHGRWAMLGVAGALAGGCAEGADSSSVSDHRVHGQRVLPLPMRGNAGTTYTLYLQYTS